MRLRHQDRQRAGACGGDIPQHEGEAFLRRRRIDGHVRGAGLEHAEDGAHHVDRVVHIQRHELVRANRIGPVVQLQTGVHRNDVRGMWRYYRLTPKMTPKTIDWDRFLGHQFDVNGEPLGPGPRDVQAVSLYARRS